MAVEGGVRSRVWPWLAALGYIFVVVMNYLAVALPLAGRTTEEVSSRFPVSLTPAGYAFSIWSLIYLALAGFAVYQLLPGGAASGLDRVRALFVLSCLLNASWLLAWHNLLVPLSLLLMLGLLASLVLIYREVQALERAGRPFAGGYGAAAGEPGGEEPPSGEGRARGRAASLLLLVPFSLYLGWISVAALVNAAVFLLDSGALRSRPLDTAWSVMGLLLLTAVALRLLRRYRDAVYALVAVWAAIAVLVANLGRPPVAVAAGSAALLLVVAIIWSMSRAEAGPDRRS